MSGKIVLGIRERRRFASGLAAHLDGTTRPDTAIDADTCRSQRGREPVETLLPDASAEVRALLQRHRENRRRGGQPNELIELILAGPPPWEHERDEDGNLAGEPPWPPEKVDAWRDASLAWGVQIFGPESKLLGAWLHADEKSPHLHLAGVPIHEGRISWKALKLRFARDFLGREKVHHRSIYSAMRDSYQEEVGKRFGLARGEVKIFDERGQDAKPIDRAKTAEHRERVAKAKAKEAEERVSQLRTSAQAALDARGEAKAQREREEEALAAAKIRREREEKALAEAKAERERQDSAAAQARAEREGDEAAVHTLRREIEAGRRGWTGRRAAAGQALIREHNKAVVQQAAGDQVAKDALANQSAVRGELNQARVRDAERQALKRALGVNYVEAVLSPKEAVDLVERVREADRRRARDEGLDEGLRARDDQLTAFAAAFGEDALRWLAAFREWCADLVRAKARSRSEVKR